MTDEQARANRIAGLNDEFRCQAGLALSDGRVPGRCFITVRCGGARAERQHSRDYLIEEVAVLSLQARERRSIKLYPGDELAV